MTSKNSQGPPPRPAPMQPRDLPHESVGAIGLLPVALLLLVLLGHL